MSEKRETAVYYLSWYFRILFQRSCMRWSESNDADIEYLVDLIIDAVRESMERGSKA